ncbi:MAG: stalk domain-containing protein [Caldisericia bacterium]
MYLGSYSHEVYLSGQVSVAVEPRRDLNVTYSPEPLTAGVIPEKIGDPLTFHVTDYNGDPVDLFAIGLPDAHGDAEIVEEAVHDILFKDPLPDDEYFYGVGSVMPQYYWLRTDLHNVEDEEGKFNYNSAMYYPTFLPIDFTHDSENGDYTFRGFIANDKGEFEVYVYTPDRKHSGVVTVKVASPKVSYEVSNKDEPNAIFDVPSTTGDPDFVLTGGDNRIYNITVTCRNAQDALLKGVAKGVSVCSGEGEDIARFTVANSILHNYLWGSVSSSTTGYSETYYHNYAGIDINDDGSLTQLTIDDSEYAEIKYQILNGNPVYYNTANTQYTDGNYEMISWSGWGGWYPGKSGYRTALAGRGYSKFLDNQRGWGRGCIYNDKYYGSYLFPDFNSDNILTFRDSFSLNEQGRTTFLFYANDACFLTGLVGYNDYCNVNQYADVAGYMNVQTRMDPNYSRYRFNPTYGMGASPDGIYQLDWEAWPDRNLEVGTPDVEIINPLTGEAWRTNTDEDDVIGFGNYDLTYGIKNHMLVKVYPADRRDIPVHGYVPEDHPSYSEQTYGDSQYNEKAATILYTTPEKDATEGSPAFEHNVVGRLTIGKDDPSDREANIYVDPTGTGSATAGLMLTEKRVAAQEVGTNYTINTALTVFNVIKGIAIEPEVAGALKVGVESTLKVKVVVAGGADEPVAGVSVKLDDKDGIVTAQTSTTNDMGVAEFKVTPTKAGKIVIRASSDVYGEATSAVGVEVEVTPPMLIIDSLPSTTNAAKIKVSGKTSVGAEIKIGANKVKVADDGTFSHEVNLEDGYNSIDITASNTAGMSTSLTVGITRDSVPPEIILDQEDPNIKVFGPKVVLTGKVEPYSKLTVNGKEATVVYDTWRVELDNIDAGELKLDIEAVDPAGNQNTITKTITILARRVMVIQDGHTNVTIDDNPGKQLNKGPEVRSGVFYAPIAVFTQFFGDNDPDIIAGTATATINGKEYVISAGQYTYTVDGDELKMTNAPLSEIGEVFVDVEYFAMILGIETEWDYGSGKMTLTMEIK